MPRPKEIWRIVATNLLVVVSAVSADGVLVSDFGGPTDGEVDVWSHEDWLVGFERVESLR